MIYDSFSHLLHVVCPNMTEQEALAHLLRTHHTYRGVAKAVGASLVTVARWCRRLELDPTPVFPHQRVICALLQYKGETFKSRLDRLLEEEGTWVKVAVKLGVTRSELTRYRYSIGAVPKSTWKQRQESGGFDLYDGLDW
jgi:alkylated DNA nucleotide flippase Atl1